MRLIFDTGRRAGIHHEDDHVRIAQGFDRDIDHEFAQCRARIVNARRIHEHDLHVVARQDAQLAQTCGLRLGADDGDLLAQQRVHQRGLAHVRPPDHGDKAAFVAFRQIVLVRNREQIVKIVGHQHSSCGVLAPL